jgi:hypothetical protein
MLTCVIQESRKHRDGSGKSAKRLVHFRRSVCVQGTSFVSLFACSDSLWKWVTGIYYGRIIAAEYIFQTRRITLIRSLRFMLRPFPTQWAGGMYLRAFRPLPDGGLMFQV